MVDESLESLWSICSMFSVGGFLQCALLMSLLFCKLLKLEGYGILRESEIELIEKRQRC
jgi:hypothetical protein